jgi:hypothetical protein
VADAHNYDAVVLGSAVFNQRWLPEADEFAQRNRKTLAARPVWLFSVGTFGDRKPIIGPLMRREPDGSRGPSTRSSKPSSRSAIASSPGSSSDTSGPSCLACSFMRWVGIWATTGIGLQSLVGRARSRSLWGASP